MVTWKSPHSQISVFKFSPMKTVKLLTLHADLILALFPYTEKESINCKSPRIGSEFVVICGDFESRMK